MNGYNSKNTGSPQLPAKLGMYTSLEDTVKYYMNLLGLATTHNFEQFYNTAKLGLDQLTFDVHSIPQTVEISVRPNKTAPLPIGFLEYLYMQVINEDGQVVDIIRNRKISSLGLRENQRPNEDSFPNIIGDNNLYSTIFGYDILTNMPGSLGVGGSFNKYGEFTIDTATGLIVLPTNFPYGKLVLSYLSNEANKNADGDYVVHIYAQLTLIRWTDFTLKSFNTKKYNQAEIATAEQLYLNEYAKTVSRFASFSEEELLDVLTKQIKLAAKS
jgi:hypothetical protein